jgi:Sec-independent protein translocase protein TatA
VSEKPVCNVVLSSEISDDAVESLTTSIELTSAKVQRTTSRAVGIDDVAIVITILVGIGQLTEYGVKLAKAIISWREQARQKHTVIKGQLQRPDQPPLDLQSATDNDIEEWLAQ